VTQIIYDLAYSSDVNSDLGASFTSASLPKSSPSCNVQTTPYNAQHTTTVYFNVSHKSSGCCCF